jgi:two-component system chemotaxis response regulator CheB
MALHKIIVVGGSAGSFDVLRGMMGELPADLPAALCIVQHIAPHAESYLPQLLQSAGSLPAKFAEDNEPIQQGRIYVAPPDYHLLVSDGHLRITTGPRENRVRPAIDPLFRSAAASYGSRVIGVVLSGLLDDGTAGLQAIKRCGGVTVVQDPDDARYSEMPRNAMAEVAVDHTSPAAGLGTLLNTIAREVSPDTPPVPEDIQLEVEIAERMGSADIDDRIGTRAPLSCPECGGPIWEMNEQGVQRYRCEIGHGFTARSLLAGQDEAAERALWAAIRTMEERARLLEYLARDAGGKGHTTLKATYTSRADESRTYAAQLRKLLVKGMQK